MGPRPARRALVVLAVAVAFLGGVTGPRGVLDRVGAWRTGAEQARLAEVRDLVGRIDAGLASGDGAALAALADPTDPALRARWAGIPRRAAQVGAEDLRLRAVEAAAGGPRGIAAADRDRRDPGLLAVPGPALAGYPQTLQVPVRLAYNLPAWDSEPVETRLVLQVGRRAGGWWLVGDARADDPAPGTDATPSPAPIEPWVHGEVGVARRDRVLVVGDPTRREENERLATALDRAVREVSGVVRSRRWNGHVVAYASTDDRIVASWFGSRAATEGRHDGAEPAAFAAEVRTLPGAAPRPGADARPVAARLAVTPMLLQRADTADDDARADAVLRHEVTHVALALEGDSDPPSWLVEGTAEYTAYRVLRSGRVDAVQALERRGLSTAAWADLTAGTWRPELVDGAEEFYRGSTAEVARAYTDAWLTCLFIADRYGEQALFTLYADSAAPRAAGGRDRALRAVLGIDRSELVRRAAGYAVGLRGRFG